MMRAGYTPALLRCCLLKPAAGRSEDVQLFLFLSLWTELAFKLS